jgi:hypothetical protein
MIAVAMHMATLSDPQQGNGGVMIATYYLGRLAGRSTHMDIERLIERGGEEVDACTASV